MQTVLLIAVIVIAFPYVAGPILLWLNGSRVPPTIMEEADPSSLPFAAESHIWKTTHFFAANGFDKHGAPVRESANNGLASYKQLWRHNETGEMALVGTFTKESDASFCNTFVAFLHERANGALVITSNFDPGARTLLDPPGTSRLSVRSQDCADLRALHRGHVALQAGDTQPLRVRDGFELCERIEQSTRQVAVATGRFRPEREGSETLRVTMWGAIFGIWINLPPLKGKYDRADRELLDRAQQALAAAGTSPATKRAA